MVSAVVLTKNEEKNIVDCIENLSFCDEIIVIDDFSSDRTAEIAKNLKASVFRHELRNDFSGQRNYGLNKAKNEWILFVDADERVSKRLADEIIEKVKENRFNGFMVKRSDTLWGKKMRFGELGSIWILRLARKGRGKWEGFVHESWKIERSVGRLKNELNHFPHQSIGEFLREINHYTDIRAKELNAKGEKVKWQSIVLYPKAKFFLNYFLKLGFLDGVEGLIFAIMMSFHSFLVRGKLWILNQNS